MSATRLPTPTKRPLLFWSAVGVVGAGAYAIAQLGFHSQDRQYKKTLAYMHEGKAKMEEKLAGMENKGKTTVEGMGKKG